MKKSCLIGCLSLVAIALLAVGAGVLAITLLKKHVTPWPERLEHVRLEPAYPHLAENDVTPDNAFFYIAQMTSDVRTVDHKVSTEEGKRFKALGWSDGAYPETEAWLEANTNLLTLWKQASAITTCQVVTVDGFDDLLPYVSTVIQLSRMVSTQSQRDAAKGNWAGTTDRFRQNLTVGQHVTRGGPLINHLVGIAVSGQTCSGMRRVALQHDVPPDVLRQWEAMLDQFERTTEPFAEALRYEWLSSRWAIDHVYSLADMTMLSTPSSSERGRRNLVMDAARRSNVLALLGSSPKQMRAHFDAVFSHMIDIAETGYDPGRYEREIESFVEASQQKTNLVDDPLGRILVAMLLPALAPTQARHISLAAHLRGTRVLLAIRHFEQDHDGRPPETLDALVPAYLDAVPADPFDRDGASLHYRRAADEWVVYSVGPNRVDDGGVYDHWNDHDEQEQADLLYSSDEFERAQEEYERKQAARERRRSGNE